MNSDVLHPHHPSQHWFLRSTRNEMFSTEKLVIVCGAFSHRMKNISLSIQIRLNTHAYATAETHKICLLSAEKNINRWTFLCFSSLPLPTFHRWFFFSSMRRFENVERCRLFTVNYWCMLIRLWCDGMRTKDSWKWNVATSIDTKKEKEKKLFFM